MRQKESYWAYKAPPTPELRDLPESVFSGDERAWESLSPGMRRTIWREATKRTAGDRIPPGMDDARLTRADEMHKQGAVQIAARETL